MDRMDPLARYATGVWEIWEDEIRFNHYWRLATEAIAIAGREAGLVPSVAVEAIIHADRPHAYEVQEQEDLTLHEPAAFLQVMRQHVGARYGGYVGFGATSSDLTDTALASMVQDTTEFVKNSIVPLLQTLATHAVGWSTHLRLGRTHGRIADATPAGRMPAILGSRIATALDHWLQVEIPGKISGPLGDHRVITPEAERIGLRLLGLRPDPVGSTQVVPRQHLHRWAAGLIELADAIDQLATWVRFECIEGVDQMRIHRNEHYVGSSSMAHKSNPSEAERVCGLSILVKALARAIQDCSVLWADRDLTHSSVERVAIPQAADLLSYMAIESNKILESVHWLSPDPKTRVPDSYWKRCEAILKADGRLTESELGSAASGAEEHRHHTTSVAERSYHDVDNRGPAYDWAVKYLSEQDKWEMRYLRKWEIREQ